MALLLSAFMILQHLQYILSLSKNILKTHYLSILHWTIGLIFLLLFLICVVKTQPNQISDFLYYWDAAKDFHLYNRSGILLLLYAPFHWFHIPSFTAAFIINGLSWISIVSALAISGMHSSYKRSYYVAQQLLLSSLLLPLGIWFIGMFPLVNSDIPHLAFMLVSMRMIIHFIYTGTYFSASVGGIILTLGLSIRAQALPIVLGLIAIFILYALLHYKKMHRRIIGLILLLCVSVVGARTVHTVFAAQSTMQRDITLMERITLYTDILHSDCGWWSKEASTAAQEDLSKPFTQAIRERLSLLSPEIVEQRLLCKLNNIKNFNGFGTYWLRATLAETGKLSTISIPIEYFTKLQSIEENVSSIYKYLFLLIIFFPSRKKPHYWYIAMSIFLLYFLQHLLLEIQPRYYIVPLVLPTMLRLFSFATPELLQPKENS